MSILDLLFRRAPQPPVEPARPSPTNPTPPAKPEPAPPAPAPIDLAPLIAAIDELRVAIEILTSEIRTSAEQQVTRL